MTANGGSTPPYSPSGAPFVPSPGPPLPPHPGFTSGSARPRRAGIAIALATVAVVLAAAALIVAVVRGGQSSAPATPTAQLSTSPTAAASDTSAVDKALCEAIAPLMKASNDQANDWVGLGDQGTPARDAALPKFVSDTKEWVPRAQAVVDAHPGTNPYLTRTLQRYIDDLSLYATNVSPGPKQIYDAAAWNDSLVAYGGPKSICRDLGVSW